MNNVNYKALKSIIIKSCKSMKKCDCDCPAMKFEVDFEKLSDLANEMGLTPLKVGLISKPAHPQNIPFLSEYFEKEKLSWFSDSKFFSVLTFIDNESIDEKAQNLIDLLASDPIDTPENDKVKNIATLVAEYPCYFATVVAYQNNDPNRAGRPSYEIICRANKVVIRNADYQYNYKDFS